MKLMLLPALCAAPLALSGCPGTPSQTVVHDIAVIEKAVCTVVEDLVPNEWVTLACTIGSVITGAEPQHITVRLRRSALLGSASASATVPAPASASASSSASGSAKKK